MKALCVQSPHHLVIEERPMPAIQAANEVLIKVKAAGICGSDVHIYHGTSPVATYPRVIGHEIAGEVMAIGTQVTFYCGRSGGNGSGDLLWQLLPMQNRPTECLQ